MAIPPLSQGVTGAASPVTCLHTVQSAMDPEGEPLEYHAPSCEPEALELRQTWGEEIWPLAGGTDLVVRARREGWPRALLSLRHLPWRGIGVTPEGVVVGALTTATTLEREAPALLPLLASAASWHGGPQVRNRATVGGNIANASPAADMALALLVLDAQVELVSAAGARWVTLREFFVGPGHTILQPTELVRAVRVPPLPPDARCWFRKVGPRSRHFISRVAVAGLFSPGPPRQVRIGLGAVGPTPLRALETERYLSGLDRLSEAEVEVAGSLASAECSPIDDVRASAEYRRHVVGVLVRRFVREVIL